MWWTLITRLFALKTIQIMRATSAPLGPSIYRSLVGAGLLIGAFASGALSFVLFLLALFLELAHLLYRDPVLWLGGTALAMAIILLALGSYTIKKAWHFPRATHP